MTKTEFYAKAAESGADATAAFKHKKKTELEVPKERVNELATEVLTAIHDTIRKHKVTYAEYDALKNWLINVGEDGEWPLFLDVWVEHVVEDVATSHRQGNKGTIEGPYYVPDSPEQGAKGTLPKRDDEPGEPLVWNGQIRSIDGTPLAGKVELWHADSYGFYSQYDPACPSGTSAARSPPVRTASSRSPASCRRPTRSPRTAPAASSSPPPAGTRGAPRTCTSRCRRPATSCSPPSSTSPATRTTRTTSLRPSSPSSCSTRRTTARGARRSSMTSSSTR